MTPHEMDVAAMLRALPGPRVTHSLLFQCTVKYRTRRGESNDEARNRREQFTEHATSLGLGNFLTRVGTATLVKAMEDATAAQHSGQARGDEQLFSQHCLSM